MPFRSKLKPGDFLVVVDKDKRTTWRLPITKSPGGEPDRGMSSAAWAALFSPGGHRGNKYAGPNKEEARSKLKAIYRRMEWEMPHGSSVKAVEIDGKRFIVLWTSNAFEDREKEIFETKAWQEYVERRDLSGRRDRVWFWHVKGTDFATVVWQDVVGRMLVEVAEVDNTEFANKMFHALQHPEEFGETLPEGWGTSHGYLYRASDKKERVYGFVEKFESTVLPAHKASNLFGEVKEVLDMTVANVKSNALAELVGDELAETMLAEALKATEALEQAGVAHKEEDEEEGDKAGGSSKKKKKNPFVKKVVDEEEEDDEEERKKREEEEEDAKSTDDLFELELDEPLLKEIAKHASQYIEVPGTKEIESLLEGFKEEIIKVVAKVIPALILSSKEEVVQEALSGRLVLKPYVASKDNGNVTTEEELPDVESDEKARKKDPVLAVVRNVMGVGK